MHQSVETILSLGSNIGDRFHLLHLAITAIEKKIGAIVKKSSIYETEPWGVQNQDFYLNQVISVKTKLPPVSVLSAILEIEEELGRTRQSHYGPRTMDIDILYYAHQIIHTENLKIPHPFIEKRRFILVPLSEMLPIMIHPILNKTHLKLLEEVNDSGEITKWQSLNLYES
jgi:2-amino-4-hydroxy-6-hydroxymethyldihydropteridine diphosphokinase